MNNDSFSVENIIDNITKYLGLGKIEKIASRLEDLPVKIKSDLCTRLRFSGENACRKCLSICPHEAIRFEQEIKIDYDVCSDCGLCSTVCPVGALESHITEDFLLAKVKKISDDGSTVIFRCDQVPAYDEEREAVTIAIPCLGRLTETLLVGAAVYGAGTVGIDTSGCSECRVRNTLIIADQNIKTATEILAAFGREVKFIRGSMKEFVIEKAGLDQDEIGLYSRRDLFTSLHKQLIIGSADILGRRVDTFSQKKEEPLFKYHLPRRRELLLLLLKKLGEPVKKFISDENIPAASLQIKDDCIFCDNCVMFCPTSALRKSENGESVSIDFTLSSCTDCGLCLELCSPAAIEKSAAIETGLLLDDEPHKLIEGRVQTCELCGQKFFAGDVADVCHYCRLRESRLASEPTIETDKV